MNGLRSGENIKVEGKGGTFRGSRERALLEQDLQAKQRLKINKEIGKVTN